MTRKISVVPCIVTTSLYDAASGSASSGVASCARISSARNPPAPRKNSDVQM